MGRKCCVRGCKSNYDVSTAKNVNLKIKNDRGKENLRNVKMFGLPIASDERKIWIKSIPNLTEEIVSNLKTNPAVCVRHWPPNFSVSKSSANGSMRPELPPSIFEGVPMSSLPTPLPPPRTTTKSSFLVRTTLPDELEEFLAADALSYADLCVTLKEGKHQFNEETSSFVANNTLWIVSQKFCSGVPEFSLNVKPDLSFSGFVMGAQCTITTLSKNRITKVNRWSKVDEAIRFLSTKELSQHEKVIKEQINSMKPPKIGKKVYDADTLRRAFTYYATSRTLYRKLRKDFKLPSEKLLSNMTSKVSNLTDNNFIKELFGALPAEQRECVVMVDEMYILACYLFHGGSVFGMAKNKPGEFAKTTLDIMIKCLRGGPTFMFKMIPVVGLDAKFQFEQVNSTLTLINEFGGKTISVIADGNRVNQSFFKMFETVPGTPWVTTNGMFLLFDFVHLLKCIRNNWLTEKTHELSFDENGETFLAKWNDLIQLYDLEAKESESNTGVRGLSKLNEVSVRPKPVERQRVSTCLRVFCDETLAALEVHSGLTTSEGTTKLIKKVLDMWKILNVRTIKKDIRHRDPLEAVIESPDDPRLSFLLEMADLFQKMGRKQGNKRVKCLSSDTAKSLHHTLNGIVHLVRHLLATSHQFVMIGDHCADPIEKGHGVVRQGSGGAILTTAQMAEEKLNIAKTKLLLKFDVDVQNLNSDIGHQCDKCGYLLDERAGNTFDSLEVLEDFISHENKMNLCHIAGYITRHDDISEEELFGATTFYHQKYGKYTDTLDRGGLNIPIDSTVQWVFFSHIMFNCVKDSVCRKSLINIMVMISDIHTFNIKRKHALRLSNIFFNNHSKKMKPQTGKEARLKVIKMN